MTVPAEGASATYTGNGATTEFLYGFEVPVESDLQVYLTNRTTGAINLVDPVYYDVTGIADPEGGTVTYPTVGAPLTSGYQITIRRVLPYSQTYDLTNQENVYLAELEEALDRIVMMIQQLADESGDAAVDALILLNIGPRLDALEANLGYSRAFEYYGAVGDGVANDTLAILDALSDNTANVLFGKPGAIYKVDTAISVTRTTALIVDLRGATIDASALPNTGVLFTFTGTLGAARPLTADAAQGAISILLDDSNGVDLVAYDRAILSSNEVFAAAVPNGEFTTLKSVSIGAGSATVTLASPLPYRFRTADTAVLSVIALHPQVVFRNGIVTGNFSGASTGIKFVYCDRPILENILFEGFDTAAIEMQRCYGGWVVGFYARRGAGAGLLVTGSIGTVIDSCIFENILNGVSISGTLGIARNVIITSNVFRGSKSGIFVSGSADEVLIANNQITIGEQTNNSAYDGITSAAADTTVLNNTIQNAPRHGISIAPTVTMVGIRPSGVIRGNTVTLGSATHTDSRQAAQCLAAAAHAIAPIFTIDGNTLFLDKPGIAAYIKATSSPIETATITGNNLIVSGTDGTSGESGESRTACMISAPGVSGITSATIRGNTVGDVDGSAFYVSGNAMSITRASIVGNACGVATIGVHAEEITSLLYTTDNDTHLATTPTSLTNIGTVYPLGDGVAVFSTKAQMDSNLDYPENTEGRVYEDGVDNGVYRKLGIIGTGSWDRVGDLADVVAAEALAKANSSLAIAVGNAGFELCCYADPTHSFVAEYIVGTEPDGTLLIAKIIYSNGEMIDLTGPARGVPEDWLAPSFCTYQDVSHREVGFYIVGSDDMIFAIGYENASFEVIGGSLNPSMEPDMELGVAISGGALTIASYAGEAEIIPEGVLTADAIPTKPGRYKLAVDRPLHAETSFWLADLRPMIEDDKARIPVSYGLRKVLLHIIVGGQSNGPGSTALPVLTPYSLGEFPSIKMFLNTNPEDGIQDVRAGFVRGAPGNCDRVRESQITNVTTFKSVQGTGAVHGMTPVDSLITHLVREGREVFGVDAEVLVSVVGIGGTAWFSWFRDPPTNVYNISLYPRRPTTYFEDGGDGSRVDFDVDFDHGLSGDGPLVGYIRIDGANPWVSSPGALLSGDTFRFTTPPPNTYDVFIGLTWPCISDFDSHVKAGKAYADSLGYAYAVPAILWPGGEQDQDHGVLGESATLFGQVKSALITPGTILASPQVGEPEILVYIPAYRVEAGSPLGSAGNYAMRDLLVSQAAGLCTIFMPAYCLIPHDGGFNDIAHYNNIGQVIAGDYEWFALGRLLLGAGFEAVQFTTVVRSGTTITLTANDGGLGGDLEIDTTTITERAGTSKGFRYVSAATITNVSVAGRVITITLDSDVGGTLSYADYGFITSPYDEAERARGNIRETATFLSGYDDRPLSHWALPGQWSL